MGENDSNVEDLKNQMAEALEAVNVTSARVSDHHRTIIVNALDAQRLSKSTECLTNEFNENFEVAERKFIQPKLILVGIPVSMADDTIVNYNCEIK